MGVVCLGESLSSSTTLAILAEQCRMHFCSYLNQYGRQGDYFVERQCGHDM